MVSDNMGKEKIRHAVGADALLCWDKMDLLCEQVDHCKNSVIAVRCRWKLDNMAGIGNGCNSPAVR